MTLFGDPAVWLPITFASLMGFSILIYVVLDGFDLGVGMLVSQVPDLDKDRMIASIGPFWDANETWLVLAIGLLLVAFPVAHGTILTALYLPVAIMLISLIMRGVAFEFRAKVGADHKVLWNRVFVAGSTFTALSQGFMLGMYIMGLEWSFVNVAFASLIAFCLAAAYVLVGACWLIYKLEGNLQQKAVKWAQTTLVLTALGMFTVSLATPLVSPRIFEKWFTFPEIIALAPLPIASALFFGVLFFVLRNMPFSGDKYSWSPFALTSIIFSFGFAGLAYSFYPYVVPEKLTIYDAAAAPESLFIILVGAIFVVPVIAGYSVFAYTVFGGKARALTYD